ncbi:NAD-dependent epimerase/dehydratase family protein [Ruminococcus gauvreauii]|uniref:NAD-dependent epimerase/dehydratase family protein n=1 Tax=Ruminococcus gauvreauii TaxID=438033 RepID=UPI0039840770
MKVLFIGDFDIAGKYLSEKLSKEGHDVCWATSEPVLQLWGESVKGNIYRGEWRRADYNRIINVNSVDVAVYLTGMHREHYEGDTDYKSNIVSLTDVLSVLRQKPGVRFVYFSSMELAYEEAYTPVLTDLAAGEMLAEAYHQAYQVPVLILRFGTIYGSCSLQTMGFIGYELERFLEERKAESLYSKDAWMDTVYGEDAAWAVFRLLIMEKTGKYDVCSGYPVTFKEFYKIISQASGNDRKVTYLEKKQTGAREVFQGSRKLKEETGWMPNVLFQESGGEILKQCASQYNEQKKSLQGNGKESKSRIRRWISAPLLKNAAEVLGMYIISLVILNFTKDAADFRYVDIRLLFVALTAGLYGMKLGLFATILVCISYGMSLSKSGIDVSYLLYEINTWIPFIMYGIAGSVIGYVSDKKQDERETAEENYRILDRKYEFLKTLHREALEIKGQLQRQIMTTKDSFGKAYEVTVELDTLEPELILYKVIDILENVMECNKAAVCLFGKGNMNYARLKACSPKLHEELPNSINMNEYPLLLEQFREENVYVNADLLPGYPDFAAPVHHKDEIIAFIAIFDIGVDKFTLYYQNLFRILVSLVEKNLVKALEYEERRKDELYYPGTELLRTEFFEAKVALMQEQKEQFYHTFLKLKIKSESPCSREEMSQNMVGLIRGNDFAGVDSDGDYAVILINANEDALPVIRERFRKRGLETETK